MKITAIIVTKNEEENIRGCIESIKWADEIIVVDSGSRDKTLSIAREYTGKIYSKPDLNVTQKRRYALSDADITNEWILFIDADERITEELKKEIASIEGNDGINGYYINRRNYYLGKWIKNCGIYPDYTLRLFRKGKGQVNNRIVHESIEVEGKTVRLKNDMLHYSYRDLHHMIDKINYFSTNEAAEHFLRGKRISKIGVFSHAVSAFLRIFISRKGFKDGLHGFYVGFCYSAVNFLSHLKLLKLQGKI